MTDVWTVDRVARLKVCWADGWTCSQIAADLGGYISRNAVIGKVTRMKLPPRGGGIRVAPAPRVKEPKPSRVAAFNTAASARRNQTNSLAEKLAIAEAEPGLSPILMGETSDGTGIKFADLRMNTCRWPKGDPASPEFEFCGGKSIPGMPYCAHHTRKSIQSARPRTADQILPKVNRAQPNNIY